MGENPTAVQGEIEIRFYTTQVCAVEKVNYPCFQGCTLYVVVLGYEQIKLDHWLNAFLPFRPNFNKWLARLLEVFSSTIPALPYFIQAFGH